MKEYNPSPKFCETKKTVLVYQIGVWGIRKFKYYINYMKDAGSEGEVTKISGSFLKKYLVFSAKK